MSKYQRFEELPVWQTAAELYNRVLDLCDESDFPLSFAFRNQLDRAALSVSNNIAEGFEKATTKELLLFIGFAKGSSGEVRSMIAVVKDRPRLRPFLKRLEKMIELSESCTRQLAAWSGSIRSSPARRDRKPPP